MGDLYIFVLYKPKPQFMKKVIFALSVVALVGASSCNKAYTCTCTLTGTSNGYTIQNEAIPSTTKSNATTTCNTWQTSQQTLVTSGNAGTASTGTVNCSI